MEDVFDYVKIDSAASTEEATVELLRVEKELHIMD